MENGKSDILEELMMRSIERMGHGEESEKIWREKRRERVLSKEKGENEGKDRIVSVGE